eukprot:145292_1
MPPAPAMGNNLEFSRSMPPGRYHTQQHMNRFNNRLPVIPGGGPVNVAQMQMNEPVYAIHTTNLYHQNQQQQWGYQAPYVTDARSEQSDHNPPLSSLDAQPQAQSNTKRISNKSSHLRYSQSAVTVSHPPELHNKIEDELEDPVHVLEEVMTHDDTQKVNKLKYRASEPQRIDYVARLPQQVTKYAQPTTQQRGFVPFRQTHYSHGTKTQANSVHSNGSDSPNYLLQLSQLPGDCGVNTLRHIFGARVQLQSVHLVDDDKTAVLRFADRNALDAAMEFGSQFSWRAKIIADSPYLKNYDQQHVWQYQDSTKWKAHHPEMGELIERIPPRTDLLIAHGNRKYFIEKYSKQQGRQTNCRTRNQRMIRRIRITVWATRTNPLRVLGNPEIIPKTQPQLPNAMYDQYIYGQPVQYNNPQVRMAPRVMKPPKKVVTKASIAQSTPPKLDAQKQYNALQPQQRVLPSQGVKYDKNQYNDWQILDEDEDDYVKFKQECNTNQFSGIWWYASQVSNVHRNGKACRVFYVDDAHDAQEVFKNGWTNDTQDAVQRNLTFYTSIHKALDVVDPEPDEDQNCKIFLCCVYLNSDEETSLNKNEYITIVRSDRVEIVACCAINIDVIQKALN